MIPDDVKNAWRSWGKQMIEESEKIKTERKLKFVLVLGKDKRDTKKLQNLKQYFALPYPKFTKTVTAQAPTGLGVTRSRKNTAKEQFIIDNYGKMTTTEMAKSLKETYRWVKRTLALLTKAEKIIRKRPNRSPDELLSEDKWPPEMKERVISLRQDFLKPSNEICEVLKKEFNIELSVSALNFWFKKFGVKYPTKKDWLKRKMPYDRVKELLNKDFRRIDFVNYIKDNYGIYISEDIISLYIRSLGL